MSHKKYDCNDPIITFTKLIFSFSKKILYLRIRHIRMARKQQYRLPERAGMCSVVISSLKFDNKSTWNNPKISVPKMCKIVVSLSLNRFSQIYFDFLGLILNLSTGPVHSPPKWI